MRAESDDCARYAAAAGRASLATALVSRGVCIQRLMLPGAALRFSVAGRGAS